MKHQGGCNCRECSFETDIDPMQIVQCNCENCRYITGSINIGIFYAETEIEFMEQSVYDFSAGKGVINEAHFCSKKCYMRV